MFRKLLPRTLGGSSDNYYNQLFRGMKFRKFRSYVRKAKPKRIMEVGIYYGERAEEMIRVAKECGVKNIEYFGFDMFDDTFMCEKDKEHVLSKKEAESLLSTFGVKYHLFKGNTLKTLPRAIKKLPKMDFIYIDGGHDYNVVKSDWENAKKLMHKKTIVSFDDYHLPGIRKTINEIGAEYKVSHIPFIPGVRETVIVRRRVNG